MPRKLLDVSKLAGLGWTAGVDLREGLGRTYRSFLETVGTIAPVTAVETPDTRRTVLEPPGRWSALKLGELWHYRELLYILAWRDVKVRYKQAVLGAAWAVLQPLVMMGIFTLLFSRIADVPTGGVPYPVFAFVGPRAVDDVRERDGGLGRAAWWATRTSCPRSTSRGS